MLLFHTAFPVYTGNKHIYSPALPVALQGMARDVCLSREGLTLTPSKAHILYYFIDVVTTLRARENTLRIAVVLVVVEGYWEGH